jgi:hypothetical protein
MKPVFQSVIDPDRGDCLRAAIASIFDLELEQVPNFRLYGEQAWFKVYWHFLRSLGYEFFGTAYRDRHSDPDRRNYRSIDGFYIASVLSRTFEGRQHAVVINEQGMVAHDPNPNRLWLGVNVVRTGELVGVDIIERGEKHHTMLDLDDEEIKKALQAAGWTPPGGPA